MTKILPNLLSDTFHLVALARETALKQGDQAKADKLTNVAENLRGLVTEAQQPSPKEPALHLLGSSDFQALLSSVQSGIATSSPATTFVERQKVINAMAAGGMRDTEIARLYGVTREEVRLIVSAYSNPGGDQKTQGSTQPVNVDPADGPESPGRVQANPRILQSYTRWEK